MSASAPEEEALPLVGWRRRALRNSARLLPVLLLIDLVGAGAALILFWSLLPWPAALLWALTHVALAAAWLLLARASPGRALSRRQLRRRERLWLGLAGLTGALWGGAAAAAWALPGAGDEPIYLICLVVVVVAAGWPVFCCQLGALACFLICCLAPPAFSLAAPFGLGAALSGLVAAVVAATAWICGWRLWRTLREGYLHEAQSERYLSRLRRRNEEAEASRRQASLLSERRTRFLAGVNHDLRQPLQAMGIYLRLLEESANQEQRPTLRQLSEALGAIARLVDQVLEVSRLEVGTIAVRPRAVSLPEFLSELARRFAPTAAAVGVELTARSPRLTVTADPDLLSRVLANLLSNAIRYSGPGTTVTLAARRRPGELAELSVRDQGPGIPAAERERVFEAFYRGSVGAGQGAGGFGLGLSVVRLLCERMSLPLTLASRPGRGSVFRVSVPLCPAPPAPTEGPAPTPTGRAAGGEDAFRITGTVALLEDNEAVRQAVGIILRGWGARVLGAAAPTPRFLAEVARLARRGELRALVFDYVLEPGPGNGLAALAEAQRRAGRPLPCLLLTSAAPEDIAADWDRSGYAGLAWLSGPPPVLQKPATAASLAAALRGLGL